MAIKICLSRRGVKKRPQYRIVVCDERLKTNGRVTEIIGYYNPMVSPSDIKIDRDKLKWWLDRGGQLSPTLKKLISV